MVATSGNGWRLAPSLVALMNETDRLWPNRSRVSDGSIGDPAHSARTSDHNPANGWVTAVDITEDPRNGPDLVAFWDHLTATRDQRVKYLIYEGRIVASYAVSGVPAWTPRAYSGANPHDRHLHVSVRATDSALNDVSAWYGEEHDMPLNDDDLARVKSAVRAVLDEGTAFGNRSWADTNRATLTVSQAAYNNTNLIRAALGDLSVEQLATAIVAKMPAGGDVDQATVEAGVRAVLADALDG